MFLFWKLPECICSTVFHPVVGCGLHSCNYIKRKLCYIFSNNFPKFSAQLFLITRMKSSVAEFSRAELKIKIFLVLVDWSLRHRSRRSSYLPRRSQVAYSLFPYNWNMEFWRLKKLKTLQVGLYSFILNVSIKKKYNKKKKFLEVICILVDAMYFWFILFANTRHYHELLRVKH